MLAATMVTVQCSPGVKATAGWSVKVMGPPITVATCVPLSTQSSVNQAPLTVTASLNVTVTSVLAGTFVAPSAGMVLETNGAASGPSVVKLVVTSAVMVSGGSLVS